MLPVPIPCHLYPYLARSRLSVGTDILVRANTSVTYVCQMCCFSVGQSADRASLDDIPLEISTLLLRDTRNLDEEGAVYRTEDVEVCQAPQWKQKKFIFNVGPQQHYLNVRVYDRLANEDKTTLLIGHVSVLHKSCLCGFCTHHSLSGDHTTHGCRTGVPGLQLW